MILRRKGKYQYEGRLTMERIVGAISLVILLRTVVGMGGGVSTLQCELGDWESKSEISERVARVKW